MVGQAARYLQTSKGRVPSTWLLWSTLCYLNGHPWLFWFGFVLKCGFKQWMRRPPLVRFLNSEFNSRACLVISFLDTEWMGLHLAKNVCPFNFCVIECQLSIQLHWNQPKERDCCGVCSDLHVGRKAGNIFNSALLTPLQYFFPLNCNTLCNK